MDSKLWGVNRVPEMFDFYGTFVCVVKKCAKLTRGAQTGERGKTGAGAKKGAGKKERVFCRRASCALVSATQEAR